MMHVKMIEFLENRSWRKIFADNKFCRLKPPKEMGFPEDYDLRIAINPQTVDYEQFNHTVINIISDIYEIKKDDLELILKGDKTIFSVRLVDEDTQNGTIPFVKFDDFLNKIREILVNVASFVINPELIIEKIADEAEAYLNLCQFLETEKGSFVAKMQLPANEIIKPKTLYNNAVKSGEITEKLATILSFINNDVFLNETQKMDEDFLKKNKEKICISLFEKIEQVYRKTSFANVDFNFIDVAKSVAISTREITPEKRHKLVDFIAFAATQINEDREITVSGTIIELKSKDPDFCENHIVVDGVFENSHTIAEANLTSEDYKDAIDAHKYKSLVILKGLAKKSREKSKSNKKKFKFLRVDKFSRV